MTAIPEQRIDAIIARHASLQEKMAQGNLSSADFVAASKSFAEIEPVAETARRIKKLRGELSELETLLADPELKAMAQEEKNAIHAALGEAEKALAIRLLPKDVADERAVILEIRAGTGGGEAALFAGDLLRMYGRYAEENNWKLEIIAASQADVGGYKEVIASISGKNIFARLKFESGVHRVQRVPATENQGRIHTSAATVAVLPEAREVDIAIEDKDLKIDIYRASGAGGQHVNTTDSAIRITHLPTQLVVIQQDQRSQHKNRARAMQVLRARLYELERQKQHDKRAGSRKLMVGSGDRSERIRTYNFPQGRVTDHRIHLTLHRLTEIMEGELDEMIDALIAENQTQRLAGLSHKTKIQLSD